MSAKEFTGSVRVSFPSGTRDNENVWLAIEDDASGAEVVRVSLSFEAWGRIMAGREESGRASLHRPDLVGMRAENKEEFVPDAGGKEVSLAPFETDGWRARSGDFGNGHRGSPGKGYNVVFFRHVDPATGAPAPR